MKSYKIEITVTVEDAPDDMIDILSRNVHFCVSRGDLFGTFYQGVRPVKTWDVNVDTIPNPKEE
jgi:hypothetical protein